MIGREICEFQKFRNDLLGRQQHGQSVRPAGILKGLADLRLGSRDRQTIRPVLRGIGRLLRVGKWFRQGLLDRRPEDLPRVLDQFFAGMRRKGAGIFSHALNGKSRRKGRVLRLFHETGPRDHHGRDAEDFGGDAGTGLLRRAESAPAITGDHRIDLELLQSLLELVFFATDHARARIGSRRTDFAQQVDLGGRKFGENQPLQFRMRDRRHETAPHKGDRLAVQRVKPRSLPNRRHRARRNWRIDGQFRRLTRLRQRAQSVLASLNRAKRRHKSGKNAADKSSKSIFVHCILLLHRVRTQGNSRFYK